MDSKEPRGKRFKSLTSYMRLEKVSISFFSLRSGNLWRMKKRGRSRCVKDAKDKCFLFTLAVLFRSEPSLCNQHPVHTGPPGTTLPHCVPRSKKKVINICLLFPADLLQILAEVGGGQLLEVLKTLYPSYFSMVSTQTRRMSLPPDEGQSPSQCL